MRCASGFFGQALQQGIDAVARGRQTGLELIALVRQIVHLSAEQCVRALQLFVAKQQALDAVGDDVTYERKIREMIVAARAERVMTKPEILGLYLNGIYLGRGAWGIEMAAQSYFGKPAKDLTLAEGAFLAGAGDEGPDFACGGERGVAEGDAVRWRFARDDGAIDVRAFDRGNFFAGKKRGDVAVFPHAEKNPVEHGRAGGGARGDGDLSLPAEGQPGRENRLAVLPRPPARHVRRPRQAVSAPTPLPAPAE